MLTNPADSKYKNQKNNSNNNNSSTAISIQDSQRTSAQPYSGISERGGYDARETSALSGYHIQEKRAVQSENGNQEPVSSPLPSRKIIFGRLTSQVEIIGTYGQRYRIYPEVSIGQSKAIEAQTGVILRSEGPRISGFLGGGAFGEFYVAERLNPIEGMPSYCGVKVIVGELESSLIEATTQRFLTEKVNAKISHLMPLYEVIEEQDANQQVAKLYYVMPLAALGNVSNLRAQLVNLKNPELKRLVGWHIAKGLLLGLWQMHQQSTCHFDVKLDNLVVDEKGKVSLIDFGCAEQVNVIETPHGQQALLVPHEDPISGRWIGNGDRTYFSPERSEAEEIPKAFDGIKSDIYSAGLALWELVTGESVETYRLKNLTKTELDHPFIKEAPGNSLGDLMKHLIEPDPSTRWDLSQA